MEQNRIPERREYPQEPGRINIQKSFYGRRDDLQRGHRGAERNLQRSPCGMYAKLSDKVQSDSEMHRQVEDGGERDEIQSV